MTFEIYGVDSTGTPVTVRIDAGSAEQASNAASARGLRVARVRALEDPAIEIGLTGPAQIDPNAPAMPVLPYASLAAHPTRYQISLERRIAMGLCRTIGLCYTLFGVIYIINQCGGGIISGINPNATAAIGLAVVGAVYVLPGIILTGLTLSPRPLNNGWVITALVVDAWLILVSIAWIIVIALLLIREGFSFWLFLPGATNVLLLIPVCNLLYRTIQILANTDQPVSVPLGALSWLNPRYIANHRRGVGSVVAVLAALGNIGLGTWGARCLMLSITTPPFTSPVQARSAVAHRAFSGEVCAQDGLNASDRMEVLDWIQKFQPLSDHERKMTDIALHEVGKKLVRMPISSEHDVFDVIFFYDREHFGTRTVHDYLSLYGGSATIYPAPQSEFDVDFFFGDKSIRRITQYEISSATGPRSYTNGAIETFIATISKESGGTLTQEQGDAVAEILRQVRPEASDDGRFASPIQHSRWWKDGTLELTIKNVGQWISPAGSVATRSPDEQAADAVDQLKQLQARRVLAINPLAPGSVLTISIIGLVLAAFLWVRSRRASKGQCPEAHATWSRYSIAKLIHAAAALIAVIWLIAEMFKSAAFANHFTDFENLLLIFAAIVCFILIGVCFPVATWISVRIPELDGK